MSFLDRKYLLTAKLEDSSIEYNKMNFFNTDKNIASLNLKLEVKTDDGSYRYIQKDEADNFIVVLGIIKPKSNQYKEIEGVVTNEFLDEEGAVYKFELSEDCTDQVGGYICQFTVHNLKMKELPKELTIKSFKYNTLATEVTKLNIVISTSPDLPVLKELMKNVEDNMDNLSNKMKETMDELTKDVQKVNYIDDENISKTRTFSSDYISSQIKDKATKQQIEVERKRIDNLTTLEQGSTTGDAELIDARVGADGITYDNLGNGIRTQFENINDNKVSFDGNNADFISRIIQSENLFDKNKVTLGYSLDRNTGNLVENATYCTSDFIEVEQNEIYYVSRVVRVYYDKNKKYLSGEAYNATDDGTTASPQNAKYIRFSFTKNLIDTKMFVKGSSEPSEYIPYSRTYEFNGTSKFKQSTSNVLKDKRIAFLGDSYTSEKTAKSYPTFISERTGCVSLNHGEAGSCITKVGNFNGNQVESFITRFANVENDIDLLSIFGGINDSTWVTVGTIDDLPAENSTFYAGYKLLIKMALEKYTNAKIVCIIPPQVPGYIKLHNNIVPAIKECCRLYSIPVLDLDSNFSYSNVDKSMYAMQRYLEHNAGSSDNIDIHLNTEGKIKLSYVIQNFLENQFI